MSQPSLLSEAVWPDGAAPGADAGMRLQACEVLGWGTFDGPVWTLSLDGRNGLLTGDIGSGKSTLVDAVTTLLVPAHRAAYNKAAGADAKERDLRSYVLGHYKSERGEAGQNAKPVALRDAKSTYAVILGRFRNAGFEEDATLAQVFWFKESGGQPARFYVVADRPLSIAEHFTRFGRDVPALKKRLKATPGVEVFDTFPPYGAAFRRRFGIASEQALDLFHQTVSMKSVGNLTEFVRRHMLEGFPVEERVAALISHFDDLSRAHAAVLKAKEQIERLTPLVADCDEHETVTAAVGLLRDCRNALGGYFAGLEAALLSERVETLTTQLARLAERIATLESKRDEGRRRRRELERAIAENGGDRLEAIGAEIARKQALKDDRTRRAETYDTCAAQAGLRKADSLEAFVANQEKLGSELAASEERQARTQNALTEEKVSFRARQDEHEVVEAEVRSLRSRRSNLPARVLAVRERLCAALGKSEADLPFAGELIEVRDDERDWEGAAERVLHGFALSLLVSDADYARVADWVERTHLGARLVYYRVRETSGGRAAPGPLSLVRKLNINPDSPFYAWLEAELARRFDYVCCETLDQFRREPQALTRAGQVKRRGEHHEKDDRSRLDDRTRYVLGWSNEAKIAALETEIRRLERAMGDIGRKIAALDAEAKDVAARLAALHKLSGVAASYSELDWRSVTVEIEALTEERRRLEEGSDILRELTRQRDAVDRALAAAEERLGKATKDHTLAEERRSNAERDRAACLEEASQLGGETKERLFPRLDEMREAAPGAQPLTVETRKARESELRSRLQAEIDAEDAKLRRLLQRIAAAMEAYNKDYPLETRELDASIEAAAEYREMLARLEADDLPRLEKRFKELLNENTVREVANFQSQLNRERQTICERIDTINKSLVDVPYNPGRYIVLMAEDAPDQEIRDFRQALRGCTEGALTGSEDEAYAEAKFKEVEAIIARFRGRPGSAEIDERWTRKVTDVRNWFVFSASERWREDGREHEHYSDSGGKSGGQKEKLAYTVLAASLAYQFRLEWGESRSRSFRFVVIDEAFGRGSDESARYGLELFRNLNLQILIATPLQKIHVIEPYVAAVGFVHNEDGKRSMLRNLTIEEYRAERAAYEARAASASA